jgi:hypothetical protein
MIDGQIIFNYALGFIWLMLFGFVIWEIIKGKIKLKRGKQRWM